MPKFIFTRKDKAGKLEKVGYLDMKNEAQRATLNFYGDIVSATWQSEWYAEDKCPQDIANFFNELDPNEPVDIYINSGGGDAFAGIAICNILKRHAGKKTGHVDALAASIASVILAACDERVIGCGAQVMHHKPWSYAAGNADDMRRYADQLDKCEESILDWYEAAALEGVSREEIKAEVDAETWYTADEYAAKFACTTEERPAVAAAASAYYEKYTQHPALKLDALKPEDLEDEEKPAAPGKADPAAPVDEKNEILADLYLYGTTA